MPSSANDQPFDMLTGDYAQHRPAYPDGLLATLREHYEAGRRTGWPHPELVVDVGAGTGIATRLLRRRLGMGPRIVALEPSDGMRAEGAAGTLPELAIEFRAGTAEQLPFEEGVVALVSVAQAVQWFDRPRFYAEARRVLAPGGSLAILQNNRDWRSNPFLAAYESFLETYGDNYNRDYRAFDIEAELWGVDGLAVSPAVIEIWVRPMPAESFIGMARSSSRLQGALRRSGEGPTMAALRALLAQHVQASDVLPVVYRSELYLARRVMT